MLFWDNLFSMKRAKDWSDKCDNDVESIVDVHLVNGSGSCGGAVFLWLGSSRSL